ncbi:MAG: hypothetical protein ABIP88_00565 [Candidatus Binatia bacterium]
MEESIRAALNSPKVAFIVGAMLALLLSITIGCENIALIKRPAPQLDADEIVGEITGTDSRLKQIYLRSAEEVPSRASTQTVRFDDNIQVLYRGREYSVSSLEVGDIVAFQVWPRDRARSANLIRVQQSRRDRDVARTGTEIQRIEGTVERFDSRNEFELRERSGVTMIVSLPPNARQSVIAQVERLRRGDHVLAEGRYVSETASSWRICSKYPNNEVGMGTLTPAEAVDAYTFYHKFRKYQAG